MTTALGTIRQVAYVVDDLEKALNYWVEVMKAGPFFLFEHAIMEDQRYRGGASNVDVSLAVGNSGDVQIELIYCEDDNPSVYKEFRDAGRVGVHHVGLMPEDYEKTYAQYVSLGYEAAYECNIGGTRLVYFDTVASLGHFTELWENSEAFKDFMAQVKAAAKNWNGEDPVRDGSI